MGRKKISRFFIKHQNNVKIGLHDAHSLIYNEQDLIRCFQLFWCTICSPTDICRVKKYW